MKTEDCAELGIDCRCQLADTQTTAQFLPGERTKYSIKWDYWWSRNIIEIKRRGKASSFQSLNQRLQNCSLPPPPPTLSWPQLPPCFIHCIPGLVLALPKLHPPPEERTANLSNYHTKSIVWGYSADFLVEFVYATVDVLCLLAVHSNYHRLAATANVLHARHFIFHLYDYVHERTN